MSGTASSANIPSVISDGGAYEVASGTSVSGVTILSGALNVAGSASGTQLYGPGPGGGSSSAASEHVLSGGIEYQVVATSGFISVASGGTLVSATLEQSGLVVDGGTVESVTALLGAQVSATNGARINSATTSQYGCFSVDDSSYLENSVIGSGACLAVEKGATFENVTLLSSGVLLVDAGSGAGVIAGSDLEGITFQSGSKIYVMQGTISGFHLPADVSLTIDNGNSASNLVIAGTETIGVRVHDQNSIIQSGGTQVITPTGIAFETHLERGGSVYVSSGGSIVNSDDTQLSQGVVVLEGAVSSLPVTQR